MSKPSYRPRRTRIYGANYDIGESYYKKQLEGLDNKYSSNSRFGESPVGYKPEKRTPEVSFRHDNDDDDLFKFTPRKSILNKLARDDFDDELADSSFGSRGYASKLDSFEDRRFGERESHKSDIHARVHNLLSKDRTPFLNDLETQGNDEFTSSRRLKIRSEIVESNDLATEQATSRARATKARLADLESEMFNITEKQNEREKRNVSLRKLLNESDAEDFKPVKRITFD